MEKRTEKQYSSIFKEVRYLIPSSKVYSAVNFVVMFGIYKIQSNNESVSGDVNFIVIK